MAAHTGRRIVDLVWGDVTLSQICTRAAFRNAVVTVLAIGGSTNAIIHLIAMARRLGVELGLADFEELGRRTPLLANIRPSGAYLMEDFFYAGGLPALLNQLGDLLDTSAVTANGRTVGENIARAKVFNDEVIRSRDNPVVASDTLAVLFGNLAPDGAVIKPPAAEPRLHRHGGPAVVFANYDDMAARIDDPDLEVDQDSVLVLQSAGPQGAPGMPEWGQLPIPKKLLERGVRDMVRISDARMSGTSYGACVLHVAPESFVGGPLALVRDGDIIELDVAARRLHLQVSDEELDKRRADWQQPPAKFGRGYGALYLQHITQADQGCDFDFLEAGPPTPEPEIH
jgi:dihydroxyacid dehydratase/phosphogluconate dehydratase